MSKKPLNIHYEVVDLTSVASYFVQGFSKKGDEIEQHDFYVDAAKGKMIFKLYVREEP